MSAGRILITLGLVLVVAGLAWEFGGRHIPLGRLPGDIQIHRGNFHLYVPIVTSLVLSVVLTLVLWLIRRIG